MKAIKILFIITLFIDSLAYAKVYHFENYKQASESKEFIKFESESTKLGLVTTSFDGFAKDFELTYKNKGNTITEVFLVIKAQSLDTDSESRDEKMHDKIIAAKKYQHIVFAATEPFELKEGSVTLKGRLTIQKQTKEKNVELTIAKNADGGFTVTGLSHFGLTEYQLPDPSISIASVRDIFDVKFAIDLKL